MKARLVLMVVVLTCLFAFAGTISGPYLSRNDVRLKIPNGFPLPDYTFKSNKTEPEIFMIGRKLFYDPILSKDSSVSCESCHQRYAAFAHIDHSLSHGVDSKIGTRNVPSLQNLIWKKTFMWDGGVNNLEVQPLNPITNPAEMGETLPNVINKLKASSEYRRMFKKAYGDTLINSERLLKSLAQFTGLLISASSRYDKYVAGKDTFSSQEKSGLELFRKKCSGCHREPLFTDNSYRDNGLMPDTTLNDKGRGKVTGLVNDDYKFQVPGLRNIELTFPYMHDGRFKKLKDVLNHYAEKAKGNTELAQIGPLSEKDKKDIIAFLLTLTDRDLINDRRFANPAFIK
ncbi:MAG: putative cytochrome c peroxidase precursor [Bacteroidota bacterium]|jgi:cytochrome c peroxidase|nr:putative cytochrome c peroxidase precursor [Bacteroidota bacterium]